MLAEFYPEQLWLASAGKMGWLGIVPSGALLITIGNLGAAGGYLAATARIPFAVGIDKMLPPAFGKLHPPLRHAARRDQDHRPYRPRARYRLGDLRAVPTSRCGRSARPRLSRPCSTERRLPYAQYAT